MTTAVFARWIKPAAMLPVIILTTLLGATQAQSTSNTTEQQFMSGGRIDIQLESGAYEVRPSPDNHIRVTWTAPSPIKVSLNTNGTHADLHVSKTPNNNFHAVIEVPATSDIKIRLTAGDLQIGAITGSKDVSLRAGDLNVNVGEPNDYASVQASVRAGDLNAGAFGISKGGLFRSFRWSGPGRYTLRAHLIAGDVNLHK